MAKVEFKEERCKGCGLCTIVCPEDIIALAARINKMGY
ncbi:MAG: 4Fe-4S binding protein, partial [Firmicutes bacterium]|nr:4Fe-4S binding protein [Bacillota bacterium]